MNVNIGKFAASQILLTCTVISLATFGYCEENKAPAMIVNSVPDSRNQIIKLTDKGIVPSSLKMKKEDSIVFFVNESSDSLISLEINFGNKHTHCSSSNLLIKPDGKISSFKPFAPNDFSSTCFHESGTYPFTVLGLKTNPKGLSGVITVE